MGLSASILVAGRGGFDAVEKGFIPLRDKFGTALSSRGEDELSATFNATHPSSSERTPESSHSSSPSVSMHLHHIDRNLSPSPDTGGKDQGTSN